MKHFGKAALLATAVMAATLSITSAAHGLTFTPPGTAVQGTTTTKPTFRYGSATFVCDKGTMSGTTGNPAAAPLDMALTFSGNCNFSGLAFTVTCTGTLRLTAKSAVTTSVAFDLNAGSACTMALAGVCNITIAGPQTTGDSGTFNETTTTVTARITFNATRTGSALCGPASGAFAFTASYNLTPTTLAIT